MSKGDVSVKDLSKMIREFVKKEIESYKSELISEVKKEVKAELFDIVMSNKSNGATPPKLKEDVTKDISRTELRKLFESRISPEELPASAGVEIISPYNTPDSYTGPPPTSEAHQEVIEAVNRDYSAVMKKMGI